MTTDKYYLKWAVELAKHSFDNGYSPVGAIVVSEDDSQSIPRYSRREIGNILHAEYLALGVYNGLSEKFDRATLYSTLEPCIMCSGMAAVLKINRVVWLVDDLWGGATRVYNQDSPYIKSRLPKMEKVYYADLHNEAQRLWIEYLVSTGHPDAIQYMLGLNL